MKSNSLSEPFFCWSALLVAILSAGLVQCSAGAQEQGESPRPIPYLRVDLQNWLDAGSLKPGRTFSARADNEWQSPSCMVVQNAKVYGHVIAASKATKADRGSTLTLAFDAVDCHRKGKVPLPMMVVEVIGARTDADHPLLTATSPQVSGRGRQVSDVETAMGHQSAAANVDTGPVSVHPGAVLRIPNVRLLLATGSDGASKLTGSDGNIRLIPGVTFILTSADLASEVHASLDNQ